MVVVVFPKFHSSQVVPSKNFKRLYHQFLENESSLEGEHIIVVFAVFPKFLKPKLNQEKETHKTIQSDSSDDNVEVDDSDNDDNNNVDSFEWNDTPRPLRQFQFIGTPVVKVEPADITSHLECLKLFLSDNVISNIVEYTNSYAETM